MCGYSELARENANKILNYFARCDLPKYDRLASFRACDVAPCPACGSRVAINENRECAGHGEFYDVCYIVCSKCHLRLPIYNFGSIDLWNSIRRF